MSQFVQTTYPDYTRHINYTPTTPVSFSDSKNIFTRFYEKIYQIVLRIFNYFKSIYQDWKGVPTIEQEERMRRAHITVQPVLSNRVIAVKNANIAESSGVEGEGRLNNGVEGEGRLNNGVEGESQVNNGVEGEGRLNNGIEGEGRLNNGIEGEGRLNNGVEGESQVNNSPATNSSEISSSTNSTHLQGPIHSKGPTCLRNTTHSKDGFTLNAANGSMTNEIISEKSNEQIMEEFQKNLTIFIPTGLKTYIKDKAGNDTLEIFDALKTALGLDDEGVARDSSSRVVEWLKDLDFEAVVNHFLGLIYDQTQTIILCIDSAEKEKVKEKKLIDKAREAIALNKVSDKEIQDYQEYLDEIEASGGEEAWIQKIETAMKRSIYAQQPNCHKNISQLLIQNNLTEKQKNQLYLEPYRKLIEKLVEAFFSKVNDQQKITPLKSIIKNKLCEWLQTFVEKHLDEKGIQKCLTKILFPKVQEILLCSLASDVIQESRSEYVDLFHRLSVGNATEKEVIRKLIHEKLRHKLSEVCTSYKEDLEKLSDQNFQEVLSSLFEKFESAIEQKHLETKKSDIQTTKEALEDLFKSIKVDQNPLFGEIIYNLAFLIGKVSENIEWYTEWVSYFKSKLKGKLSEQVTSATDHILRSPHYLVHSISRTIKKYTPEEKLKELFQPQVKEEAPGNIKIKFDREILKTAKIAHDCLRIALNAIELPWYVPCKEQVKSYVIYHLIGEDYEKLKDTIHRIYERVLTEKFMNHNFLIRFSQFGI